MSSRRWLFPPLALAAAAACFGSRAEAQQTPPGRTDLPVDVPSRSDREEIEGGDTGTYRQDVRQGQARDVGAGSDIGTTRASTTRTTSAPYEREGEQPGAEKRYWPNRPLLVAGGLAFLSAYATSAIVAAESPLDADKRGWIPVVGPWLDVGQRPCTFGSACSTGDKVATVSFIGGGVAQLAGLVLVGISFVAPEKERKIPREGPAQAASLHVTPISFGAGGGGLGAIGTF